jgi:[protein-PII] uridylyltransferase
MAAPLLEDDEDSDSVFSPPRIRARLVAGQHSVAAFRETLAWGRQRLFSLFHDGAPAQTLVHARAHLVDEVLAAAWQKFLPQNPADLAMVAVGGYGRGELLPHSDIDILLLHEGEALQQHQRALEQLTAFCWDIGLEVGQSVRTVADCVEEARKDITVMTNLLEARALSGDGRLLERMNAALTPDQLWSVTDFFRGKKAEQAALYRKFDDTGYKLEPNVKEGPGGLRDLHTVGWVAQRYFGRGTLLALKERGFLTAQECRELFAGQDFLWRVRFALHMLTGRREDRLLFDHQIKVAALFGYEDNDRNRAVEQFMQLYYRTIKSLSCLNDLLLQLFEEQILEADRPAEITPINARFQRRGNDLETVDDSVFQRNPWALVEVFHLLQTQPRIEGLRAETLRRVLRDGRLLDDNVRYDRRARSLFIEMFRHGRGLTRTLRRMNRYGVLGRYLPAFGKIVGLMQYDLFHTLTVDEHVLYVLRNARRFAMERFATELPFAHEVMARLQTPELLYLAALWHDMAKGRGGDHSEIGAEEAAQFCLDHGLSHGEAELVAWLVRSHLVMSLTAQKQDLSDPQVITDFAAKVGSRERLDYLFLLTCADIRATNPALWNSWRESLLTDLYRAAARALDRGLSNPVGEAEQVAETQAAALRLLQGQALTADAVDAVWSRFDADYFLRHSPQELAWHLPALAGATPERLPLVLVRTLADRGTTVFIYTYDRDHLFGLSTGVLARLGLNILDARLQTTRDGHVLDTYVVAEADNRPIDPGIRFEEIVQQLTRVLSDPETSTVSVNRRTPHRLKHFNTPTRVHFRQDSARGRTQMELVTADQPGLLSMIGRIFARRGILLDAAKVATIGERAEDVFTITDRLHRPITDERTLEELREVITRTLDRPESDS